jgi:hypothetical protein
MVPAMIDGQTVRPPGRRQRIEQDDDVARHTLLNDLIRSLE